MRESVTVFTSLVMIRQLAVKHFVTYLGISVVKLLFIFLYKTFIDSLWFSSTWHLSIEYLTFLFIYMTGL